MELRTFFREHPKVALGFSGGVDSSYLLYAAREYGAEIGAYFIKSQFQPDFELADAKRLAEQVGTELRILKCDILAGTVGAGKSPGPMLLLQKPHLWSSGGGGKGGRIRGDHRWHQSFR